MRQAFQAGMIPQTCRVRVRKARLPEDDPFLSAFPGICDFARKYPWIAECDCGGYRYFRRWGVAVQAAFLHAYQAGDVFGTGDRCVTKVKYEKGP